MRALSRQLLAMDAADDVEQETWLAMLEGGAEGIRRSRRGWLAGVARNLSRHEHRRRRRSESRERHAAQGEVRPSTIDEVQRRETLRIVSGAVFELPEPLQRVIVLRYYENLSRGEIGARLGIGVDGVKSRLRRALAELRTRLDHAHGGERGAWTATLAVISDVVPGSGASASGMALGGASSSLTTGFLGVLLMSSKTLLVGGGVGVAALILVWFLSSGTKPGSEPDETTVVAAPTEPGSELRPTPVAGAVVPVRSDGGDTSGERGNDVDPLATGVVHGRVVDERRRPVAGATVELWIPDRELRTKHTDADGRFRFVGLERPDEGWAEGAVLAYDGRGHAAVVACSVSARSVFEASKAPRFHAKTLAARDLEEIPLRLARRFEVMALDGGKPAAGVELIVECGLEGIPMRDVVTDGEGRASLPWLPEGVVFVATARGNRVGYSKGPLDATSSPLVVSLEPAQSVDVFVIDARTGEPIEGADVTIRVERLVAFQAVEGAFINRNRDRGLDIAPTDGSGRTHIDSLPLAERVVVVVTKSGYGRNYGTRWTEESAALLEEGAAFVEIPLDRFETRSVHIPVADGLAPVPEDGTPLSIRERPNFAVTLPDEAPTAGRLEDGFIRIDDVPPGYFAALVETPEGLIAPIRVDADGAARETSFRPGRTIEVRVSFADGSPAVGAPIQISNMPSNVFETDDTGTARIDGLYGDVVRVMAYHPDHEQCVVTAGAVDLAVDGGRLEATLPLVLPLQLQFFDEGEPRLPSTVRLNVEPGSGILEERPHEGVLVVGVYPSPEVEAYRITGFFAEGYLTPEIKVPKEFAGSEQPYRVDLVPECSITVTPSRPEGAPMELMLERWDDKAQGFGPMQSRTKYEHPTDGRGRVRVGRLAAGRYRVRDEVTAIVSDPVEVSLDQRHAEVSMNLAGFGRVAGRVITPSGTDLSLVRIVVREPGMPRRESSGPLDGRGVPEGLRVNFDGTFELSLPSDRSLLVEAWHPLLTAPTGRGAVEVDASAPEILLELEEGPEVRFAVPADAGRISFQRQGIYVELYEGLEASGTPVFSTQARIEQGVAKFGGFEPGRYTVWIDPSSGYAPIVIRDFDLHEGDQELELDFERGSSIRLRILIPDGEVVPQVVLGAALEGENPTYRRWMNARGESDVILHGLGPGTFRVTYGIAGEDLRESTVRLDATSEHEFVIDLR